MLPSESKVPNTSSFGTGGGGDTFQFRVQLGFFVTMLIDSRFPCLDGPYREIKWIKTQGRPTFITDDLDVCILDLNGKERKLLGQIKHKLTFTKGDEEYQKTLRQAWDDYKGGNFDPTLDAIAIITGPIPTQIAIDTVRPLFEAARASTTLEEFQLKAKESKARDEKLEAIRSIINAYAEESLMVVSDEDLWNFCRVLHLLSFDDDYGPQSVHKAKVISTIQTGLVEDPHYNADTIYHRLFSLVAEYNLTGATRRRNDLPSDITACFRSYQKRFSSIDPWELPLLSDKFVGQMQQIDVLNSRLKLVSGRDPVSVMTILGTGGIGKTYLATRISSYPPHTYKLRAWFNATTEEALNVQYKSFAEDVNLSIESKSPEQIRRIVKQWFQQNPEWLIIYDNAESKSAIQNYIPSQGGQVIITSRLKKCPNAVKINLMTQEDSILVLKKYADPENNRFGEDTNFDAFDSLADELGRLPLALSQAGAYMYITKITPEKYLELYKESKKAMMETDELEDHEPVYFTWDVTVTHLQVNNPKTLELLNIIACYNSKVIPRKLLVGFDSELELNTYLAVLDSYSLIELSENVISLHQVLADVTLEKQREKETHSIYLLRALVLFQRHFKFKRDDSSQLQLCQELLTQGMGLLSLIKIAGTHNYEIILLEYEVGLFLLDYMQDLNNALFYLKQAYEAGVDEKTSTVAVNEILQKRITRQLGKTYGRLKKWDEAEKLLLEGDLDSAEGLCDLASFYLLRKGYIEHPTLTIEEMEQAENLLDMDEDNDGSKMQFTQTIVVKKDELAQIPSLQKTREYQQEAKKYIEIARKAPNLTNKEKAWIAHLYGTYYLTIYNLEKAKEEYTLAKDLKVAEYSMTEFPDGHPEIARTLIQLGRTKFRIYQKFGLQEELKEAILHLEEALNIKIQFYQTKQRIDIVELLVELAIVCARSEDTENKDKEVCCLNNALDIKRSGLRETSKAWGRLGDMLFKQRRLKDALVAIKGSRDALSKKIYHKILPDTPTIPDYFTSSSVLQTDQSREDVPLSGNKRSSSEINSSQKRIEQARHIAKKYQTGQAGSLTTQFTEKRKAASNLSSFPETSLEEQIALWCSFQKEHSRNIEDDKLFGLTPYDVFFKVGNCLFDAIKVQESRFQDVSEVRAAAIARLRSDPELQGILQVISLEDGDKLKLCDNSLVAFSSPEQYIVHMSQDRTWGTYLEIVALSRTLQKPIVIFSQNFNLPQIVELADYQYNTPIFLQRKGEHYRPMSVPEGYTAENILREIRSYNFDVERRTKRTSIVPF